MISSFTGSPLLFLLTSASTFTALYTSPYPPSGGMDPNVLAALIGAAVALVVAVISVISIIYQTRDNRKLQHELFKLQQQQANYEKEQAQIEQVQKEQTHIFQHTQKLTGILFEYRDKLLYDPNISQLQVLSMSRPLEVTNIYIRVRLHEEVQLRYELEPALVMAEQTRDPNKLLVARRQSLEQKTRQALDPEEALLQYHHCVFIGDPGAGKTTLLKYLALQTTQGNLSGLPDIPIHISLSEFVASINMATQKPDLIGFAASTWEKRYHFPQEDARIAMQKSLAEGNALLLLDALDETVTGANADEAEATYARVVQIIVDFKTAFPHIHIAVTARKAGYYGRPRLTGFTELEVLDFTQNDIEQFIKNWFDYYHSASQHGNPADLIAQLHRNSRIQALAANPLLLSLIVLVYQAQLDLPDQRAELYKQCVELLLKEWDAQRGIRRKREFKPEYKLLLLEELAWHFHQQGQRYFPDKEVIIQIAHFLPVVGLPREQSETILREIANENGLLKEQAQGWHGFLHLTLQEYFVARYIDHNTVDLIARHFYDPWWQEAILLYAGQAHDASSLLKKLLMQEQNAQAGEDLFHRSLFLAAKCLAARPVIRDTALRQQIVDLLFETLLTTPHYTLQYDLPAVLATIGGNEINTRLVSLLTQHNLHFNRRRLMARAIGVNGDPAIAPQLLALLTQHDIDSRLREHIADALGNLGDATIAPQLIPLLADERLKPHLRNQIARALGNLGTPAIAPQLLPLLSNDKLPVSIRSRIAQTLGKLGNAALIPQLFPLLSNYRLDASLRHSIARTLGTLGDASIISQLLFLLTNNDLDTELRGQIALALGNLGEPSVAYQLLPLLTEHSLSISLRGTITNVIGSIGEHSIAPQLRSLLYIHELPPTLRGQIADAIGKIGNATIVPQLLPLLSHHDLDVPLRGRIANAIGALGEHSIAPQLVSLLYNNYLDISLRIQITSALGSLGNTTIAPQLLSHLTQQELDYHLYTQLVITLGELGEPAIIPQLVSLLAKHGLSDNLRGHIADILGSLGDASIMPQLLAILSQPELDISLHRRIANTVGVLVENTASLQQFTRHLWSQQQDNRAMTNNIYIALRRATLRLRINIYVKEEATGTTDPHITIVPWG